MVHVKFTCPPPPLNRPLLSPKRENTKRIMVLTKTYMKYICVKWYHGVFAKQVLYHVLHQHPEMSKPIQVNNHL